MSLQIPQLRLVIIKIEGAYKKKSAGICTCHSSHALRPSRCPSLLNEQRRSPRRYVYNLFPHPACGAWNGYKHIPQASTVALFLDRD